ncbi:MAG TPA: tetratricopeptide repeat protein [Pyrinomonadaceae bacterium]
MSPATESKTINNPFPGLRPFETDEYRLFFGREGQASSLITRLERSHFLAIVGTSGSGKSSLVRAGLLPALRGGLMPGAGSGWRIAIMRPGSDPIGNLASALADKDVLSEAGGGLAPAEAEAVIEATLRRGSLGLVDAARQARLGEHEKLLVVVDQFEELFRFRAARPASSTGDDASAFVKLLLEAAQQRELAIYIVPTMRSDFLGDCAQFQGLPEAINDGQYLIPRMTRDERRFAITGPVGVTRGKISEPLVNRLMNDVGDNPDQLPILQHALMRTWDYWSAHRNNGEPLGLEHYEAVGTMAAALSLHADEAFNELPDERSRRIAEKLFKALTEQGADNRETRRPLPLHQLCSIAEASEAETVAVIDTFRREGRSFLMPQAGTPLEPDTIIDISHESLIRNWERLKVWVAEEAQSARIYRRLAESAMLYHRGEEGLLAGPFLQIALDWREQQRPNRVWAYRYSPNFETTKRFLDESREAYNQQQAAKEQERLQEIARERRELEQAQLYAEQQRRAAQRLRRFTFALVFISLIALVGAGAAVVAFTNSRRSESQARASEAHAERLASELQTTLNEVTGAKEEANRQRDAAVTARKAAETEEARARDAENAEEKARLDAQQKARVAEAEKTRAETEKARAQAEAVKNKRAREANDLFRDAVEAAHRGKYSDAQLGLEKAITGYEDPNVANWEAIADTHVELGNLQFGYNRDVSQSLLQFEQAAQSYSRLGFFDKAVAVRLQVGTLLLDFTKNPEKYYKSDQSDCPQSESKTRSFAGWTCSVAPIMKYADLDKSPEALAVDQFKLLFDLYRQKNNREGMTDMAYRIGDLLSNEEAPEARRESIKYFNELVNLYPNDVDVERILLRLALLHHNFKEDETANGYIARVLKLHEGGRDINNLALAGIGDTLLALEQPEKALQFYRQALASFKAPGDLDLTVETLYRIGLVYENAKQDDRAREQFRLAVASARERFEKNGYTSLDMLFSIGSFARAESDFALAKDAFQLALDVSYKQSDMRDRGRALRELGALAERQKQFPEARDFYRRALEHYQFYRREAAKVNDTSKINEVADEIEELFDAIRTVETAIEQQQRNAPPK